MGTKAKKRIARLEHQAKMAAEVRVKQVKELGDAVKDADHYRRKANALQGHNERNRDAYRRELARYKFIDDILDMVSRDPQLRNLPLFKYMRGEVHCTAPMPSTWRNDFPPVMRNAVIPELTWRMPDVSQVNSPAREMVADVLSYYLFDYYVRSEGQRNPTPVIEYECNGARRAYILPADILRLPEDEQIRVVIREITPAILMMLDEANRQ